MSDTIPKSEVAGVLAIMHRTVLQGMDGVSDAWTRGYASAARDASASLHLLTEFESALKALEEEASRG